MERMAGAEAATITRGQFVSYLCSLSRDGARQAGAWSQRVHEARYCAIGPAQWLGEGHAWLRVPVQGALASALRPVVAYEHATSPFPGGALAGWCLSRDLGQVARRRAALECDVALESAYGSGLVAFHLLPAGVRQ